MSGRWLGDPGDSRWNMFVLEHQFKVLTDAHYPGTYATAPFWYPDNVNNMAYSDLLTGAQPFYFLPRLVLSRDWAYQVFFVLAAAFNYGAFIWLARLLGAGVPAAGLAGLIAAFGPHKAQHLVHSQLFLVAYGLLCIGLLTLFLRRPSRKLMFGFLIAFGLQAITSPYSMVFFAVGAFIWALLTMAVDAGSRAGSLSWLKARWLEVAGAAAIVFAPVLLVFLPYLRYVLAPGARRSWSEVSGYLGSPGYWMHPLHDDFWAWVYRGITGRPIDFQEVAFIGAVFLLLGLGGSVAALQGGRWKEREIWRAVLVASGTAVFCIALVMRYPGGVSPWKAVWRFFPGAGGLRDVRRISMVSNTACLLAGALLLTILAEKGKRGRWFAVSIGAFALVENAMPDGKWYERSFYKAESTELARMLEGTSAFYVLQPNKQAHWAHEYSMNLLAAELDVPTVNGLSSLYARGVHSFMRPREVLERGENKMDLERFAYALPLADEPAFRGELEALGFTRMEAGEHFAVWKTCRGELNYDVAFEALEAPPTRLPHGTLTQLPVLVRNLSRYPWSTSGENPTYAGYVAVEQGSGPGEDLESRTALKHEIFPGEAAVVRINIETPAKPGAYAVRLGMVHERKTWFGSRDPARGLGFILKVE